MIKEYFMKKKTVLFGMLALVIVHTTYAQQYNSESDFQVRSLGGGKSVEITKYVGEKQTVNIPPRIEGMTVTGIGENAFQRTKIISVTLPEGLTSIGNYAFSRCTSLTSITIPASVTSIGEGAFSQCTSLTSITIPAGVTSIGNYAFNYCTGLTDITVAANNPNYASEGGILYNKAKTTLIEAPQGISGNVNIPASVTSIGVGDISRRRNLTDITVAANNPNYASEGGILYNKAKTTLIQAPGAISGNVTIPAGVTSIGNAAFSGCRSLTSITIPASVTSIGNGAFSDCSSLTSITIPASVTSIGGSGEFDVLFIFNGCTSLTSITVDANNSKYASEGGILYNKAKTELIVAPDGISGAITLPVSVTSIGFNAFANCRNLTSITLPTSVRSIGTGAFNVCTSLASITIPASVRSMGMGAFSDWTASQTINIRGHANQASADRAWSNWRMECKAKINYLGGN